MFGDNKRLHTSYLSDGVVLSSLSSSSRQTIMYQHNDPAKPSLYESRMASSGIAECNTLTERKNGVNRMIDFVDPSSLNIPLSNDAKTLNTDSSLNETRRRSHRPRGCRGGRKNRKSQQAKAQALIPKEILDDDATLHHNSPSRHFQENVQTKEKPANGNSISCAGGLPFMSQSYGGTTAFSNAELGRILDRSEQTPSPPPPPPSGILPPVHMIHESKSAVGHSLSMHTANGVNPISQNVPFYAPSHGNNMRANPYKPLPCGASTHNLAAAHNVNGVSKLPPRAPLFFSPLKSGCNPAPAVNDYQTLLFQRPMMPSGGSLFATSPRSFLFGRPSESSSIAW